MQPFPNVVLRQDSVVKLDLGVALLKLLANFGGRYRSAARHQRYQLLLQDVVLHIPFEDLDRQIVLRKQSFVGFLTDKLAAREKCGAVTAVFQLITQISVGSFKTQAVGLSHNGLARDQLLDGLRSRLRHDHREKLFAHGAVLGDLLLCESPSTLLNFDGGDVLAVHFSDNSLRRLARQFGAQPTGNQRNHHGTTENKQDSAQNDLLDRTRGLQKSNHWLITPEFWGGIVDYKLMGSSHSIDRASCAKSSNGSKATVARK